MPTGAGTGTSTAAYTGRTDLPSKAPLAFRSGTGKESAIVRTDLPLSIIRAENSGGWMGRGTGITVPLLNNQMAPSNGGSMDIFIVLGHLP